MIWPGHETYLLILQHLTHPRKIGRPVTKELLSLVCLFAMSTDVNRFMLRVLPLHNNPPSRAHILANLAGKPHWRPRGRAHVNPQRQILSVWVVLRDGASRKNASRQTRPTRLVNESEIELSYVGYIKGKFRVWLNSSSVHPTARNVSRRRRVIPE